MNAFEPVINLLVLMSVLSIAAERLANVVKLRTSSLIARKLTAHEEKERERLIGLRVLTTSILVAVVLKADFLISLVF